MSDAGKPQKSRVISRRTFLRGAALAAGGVVVAACAQQAPSGEAPTAQVVKEVVTVTPGPTGPRKVHYALSGDLEVVEKVLVPLVQERASDIELTVDVTPWGSGGWDTYADNVITRIAGGEGLDIIHIAIEGVPLLTEKKILRPLDPFLEKDGPFKADIDEDIHPILMEALSWKGQQMELPTDWNNMVIHYNYKIFEEEGVAGPRLDVGRLSRCLPDAGRCQGHRR